MKFTRKDMIKLAQEDIYKTGHFTVPNGVTEICEDAFSLMYPLMTIRIPEGVVKIGDFAFAGCDNLRELTLPSTLKHIGICAFKGCKMLDKDASHPFYPLKSLDNIVFPQSLTTIGCNAFQDCNLNIQKKLDEWQKEDEELRAEAKRLRLKKDTSYYDTDKELEYLQSEMRRQAQIKSCKEMIKASRPIVNLYRSFSIVIVLLCMNIITIWITQ